MTDGSLRGVNHEDDFRDSTFQEPEPEPSATLGRQKHSFSGVRSGQENLDTTICGRTPSGHQVASSPDETKSSIQQTSFLFSSILNVHSTTSSKRARPLANERLLVALGHAENAVRKRELDVLLHNLLDVRPANVGRLDLGHTDDLDRAETGTVTGGHVEVWKTEQKKGRVRLHELELFLERVRLLTAVADGVGTAHLTVLLVHVVGTRARVVTDPDAVVLRPEGSLLEDLQTQGKTTRRIQ